MGMWNTNSLIKLQKHFAIEVESVYLEPLQKYHTGFAKKVAYAYTENKLHEKLDLLSRLVLPIAKRFARTGVIAITKYIIGHSVIVVFIKDHA